MPTDPTTARLKTAVMDIDRSLEERVAAFSAESQCQLTRLMKILDELEREIDDLSDENAQARLRRLLARLEDHGVRLGRDASVIASHELLDPLRILATDLRHNY